MDDFTRAIEVDCPYCGAPAGELCRWPGMEHMKPNPHWARRTAIIAAHQAGEVA